MHTAKIRLVGVARAGKTESVDCEARAYITAVVNEPRGIAFHRRIDDKLPIKGEQVACNPFLQIDVFSLVCQFLSNNFTCKTWAL
jgi:hypothetical protein